MRIKQIYYNVMKKCSLIIILIFLIFYFGQTSLIAEDRPTLPLDENVKKGIELARKGEYQDAIKQIGKIVKEAMGLEKRFVLSKIYLAIGEYKKAEEMLDNFHLLSQADSLTVWIGGESPLAQGYWLYAARFGDNNLVKRVIEKELPDIEKKEKSPANLALLNNFWGNCYLEKGDLPNAEACFQDALKAVTSSLEARLGLARIGLTNNPGSAAAYLNEIIGLGEIESEIVSYEINSPQAEAFNLLANIQLANGQFIEALSSANSALKINPNSVSYHATKAAAYYLSLKPDEFDKECKAVLTINPQPALFYLNLGRLCEKRLFYNEATGFLEKAVALDGHLWEAQTALGMNYMHLGPEYENKGRKLLEDAFARDPYDVYAYNMLKVLDALNTEFEIVKTEHFEIKLHKSERFLLEPYITALLEDAYNKFTKLYQFKPSDPLLVEVFPNHNDFSVRLMGMPGFIAARGVCFVKTFLVLSPKAQEQMASRFHWGSITVHEFTHIFTLQMSNFRVPRWFTEGCSEYGEKLYNPVWGRNSEYEVAKAMSEGKLKSLSAFIDRRDADLLHSYILGSMAVEYIHKKYGMDKIIKMLKEWKDNKGTEEVFQKCLGTSVKGFDDEFSKYLKEDYFKGIDYKLFEQVYRNAKELFKQHKEKEAIAEFIKAKELFPRYTKNGDNPYYYLSVIYDEQGEKEKSISETEALVRMDQDNFADRMKLAKYYRSQKKYEDMVKMLGETAYLEPENLQLHNYLGEGFQCLKNYSSALWEYDIAVRLLLRLAPGEKRNYAISDFYCSSAEIYLELKDKPKAKEFLDKAGEFYKDNKRIEELLKR